MIWYHVEDRTPMTYVPILVGWRDNINRDVYFVAVFDGRNYYANGMLIGQPTHWAVIKELP